MVDILVKMKDKDKRNYFVKIFIVIILVLFFFSCEKRQNNKILEIQNQLEIMNNKIDNSISNSFSSGVTVDGYDYLAIGNSITIHPPVDYWLGNWGMAASCEDNDYYHLVVYYIEQNISDSVNTTAYNYSCWENQSFDRAETWQSLDTYLSPGIDLVSIQLSENCDDLSTFKSDFKALINHIEKKCGDNVKILIIDDFWDEKKSALKVEVFNELNDNRLYFINLSDIRGKEEYMVGMKTEVQDLDGNLYSIEHGGVAKHPNDNGMSIIAERIIKEINK